MLCLCLKLLLACAASIYLASFVAASIAYI